MAIGQGLNTPGSGANIKKTKPSTKIGGIGLGNYGSASEDLDQRGGGVAGQKVVTMPDATPETTGATPEETKANSDIIAAIVQAVKDNQTTRQNLMDLQKNIETEAPNDFYKATGMTSAEAYKKNEDLTDTSIQKITGGNANDLYNKIMTGWKDNLAQGTQYAQNYANQQAQGVTNNAIRKSVQGAKTAGMSQAQAAQMAGANANDTFNQNYQKAYTEGNANYLNEANNAQNAGLGYTQNMLNQYQTSNLGAQQSAQMALNQINSGRNQEIQAGSAAAGVPITTYDPGAADKGLATSIENNKANNNKEEAINKANIEEENTITPAMILKALSGAIGGGITAAITSDENAKENIKPNDTDEIINKLRSIRYNYKNESPYLQRVGITAQDLEQTPLKSTVINDGTGIKKVDTGQLTLGNTAMIADIGKKLNDLSDKFGKALDYIKKGA